MNKLDGFTCSCDAGWSGTEYAKSCMNDISCKAADCSDHGTTSDMDRNDGCTCECGEGWGGSTTVPGGANCNIDITCSAAADCTDHGTTEDLDKTDGCACSCGMGWLGEACEVKMTKEEKAV